VRGEELTTAIETDVVVIGAGVIGLAIALELDRRGVGVVVVERGKSLGEASTAAGGMLAVEDPHNPVEALELSRMSGGLYAGFLRRIEELSGVVVPFQTESTVQYLGGGRTMRMEERSIDPGQLAEGLMAAVRAIADGGGGDTGEVGGVCDGGVDSGGDGGAGGRGGADYAAQGADTAGEDAGWVGAEGSSSRGADLCDAADEGGAGWVGDYWGDGGRCGIRYDGAGRGCCRVAEVGGGVDAGDGIGDVA
jgi:hypothetical protein